jgi:hypothetical protein
MESPQGRTIDFRRDSIKKRSIRSRPQTYIRLIFYFQCRNFVKRLISLARPTGLEPVFPP